MSTLGEDLDKLGLLARREKILAKRLDEAKARRVAQEHAVYDRMVGEGWKPNESGVNRNGVRFRPKSQTFATIQDEAKLVEWLEEQEGDDFDYAGMVRPKLSKGELNRLVREKLDNGEELPPGLGYFDRTTIQKSGLMPDHEGGDEDE